MPCNGMKSWDCCGTADVWVVAIVVLLGGGAREPLGSKLLGGGQSRGTRGVGAGEHLAQRPADAADGGVGASCVVTVQLVLHRDQPARVGDEVGRVQHAAGAQEVGDVVAGELVVGGA